MQTECIPDIFGFEAVEGRTVVAAFDGGTITSDAGGCCWVRRIERSGWWIGWHRALSIGDPRPMSSIRWQRWSGSGYSPSRSATRTSTTMRRCATIH